MLLHGFHHLTYRYCSWGDYMMFEVFCGLFVCVCLFVLHTKPFLNRQSLAWMDQKKANILLKKTVLSASQ